MKRFRISNGRPRKESDLALLLTYTYKIMQDNNTIHKEIFVNASQAHAFKVFAEQFSTWWPASHHIGASELDRVIIEPQPGGRWYERGTDGVETMWGKVLAYEPPSRLLLTWQISEQWSYDQALVTEVAVTFASQNGGTLVTLEHRNLDRYGAVAEAHKAGLDGEGGWGALMQMFATAAESVAA
jgi:uncharacterized protein YndB with AHSA1/START domain